jgi:hypothetical protein
MHAMTEPPPKADSRPTMAAIEAIVQNAHIKEAPENPTRGKVLPGKQLTSHRRSKSWAQYEVSRHGHRRIARIAQAVYIGLMAQTVERNYRQASPKVSARGLEPLHPGAK